VPIREILIHHFIDTHWIRRIGNVEQDAVSRARTGCQPQLREDGKVVALIRCARALRPRTVVAALPEPRDVAGRPIRENSRPADDARLLRRRERDLDDVDTEQRRVWILFWIQRRAAVELLGRSHPPGSRSVEIHISRIVRIGHQRVRMRSAARLHGRYLLRPSDIADVEDADAAETLGADLLLNTPCAAVKPATRLLHRHEQQVAANRHVTLTAGAHDRRELPRLPSILNIVDIEPMIIADENLTLTECEIGIRLIHVVGTGPRRGRSAGSFMFALDAPHFLFFLARLLRW
jgi:hypothetical protein